jgi:uncharacterized membrane protein
MASSLSSRIYGSLTCGVTFITERVNRNEYYAMERAMRAVVLLALMLNGAIFGFFYAWLCSTMWGLDQLPPGVAIQAMQAMNATVRNMVFAPAFFGTGPVELLTGLALWTTGLRRPAALMALAGMAYILGALLPTMLVNVPMNEALALVDPTSADAAEVWAAYSGPWQGWNIARTVASGLALALCGLALVALPGQITAEPTRASAM